MSNINVYYKDVIAVKNVFVYAYVCTHTEVAFFLLIM